MIDFVINSFQKMFKSLVVQYVLRPPTFRANGSTSLINLDVSNSLSFPVMTGLQSLDVSCHLEATLLVTPERFPLRAPYLKLYTLAVCCTLSQNERCHSKPLNGYGRLLVYLHM